MGKRKEVVSGNPQMLLIPKIPKHIEAVYAKYDPKQRAVLLDLRNLIFETAASDARIGSLTETLKWGEPAYLTEETKSGSTLRIGYSKLSESPALFVSCSTSLLTTLQELDTKQTLQYHGLRDIGVPKVTSRNKDMIRTCILKTFTYHLDKKRNSRKKPRK